MKPIFSKYLSLRTTSQSTFFTYHTNVFEGVLIPLTNLNILIGKFRYCCLKFCRMMPQKISFQTALMIKGLLIS